MSITIKYKITLGLKVLKVYTYLGAIGYRLI